MLLAVCAPKLAGNGQRPAVNWGYRVGPCPANHHRGWLIIPCRRSGGSPEDSAALELGKMALHKGPARVQRLEHAGDSTLLARAMG